MRCHQRFVRPLLLLIPLLHHRDAVCVTLSDGGKSKDTRNLNDLLSRMTTAGAACTDTVTRQVARSYLHAMVAAPEVARGVCDTVKANTRMEACASKVERTARCNNQ